MPCHKVTVRVAALGRCLRHSRALLWLLAFAGCGAPDSQAPPSVASVVVSPTSATSFVGSIIDFEPVLYSKSGLRLTGRDITWASSDETVASVRATSLLYGRVTALAPGVVTIIAVSEGKSGGATLTVIREPVASVEVMLAVSSLVVMQSAQARAVVRNARGQELIGRDVAWRSSDPSVAEVSQNGRVTAVAPGVATISATVEEKSGQARLTVRAALSLRSADSVLVPNAIITLRGTSLTGAAVAIQQVSAEVVQSSDTLLLVRVPSTLFLPCRAAGTLFVISATSAAGAASMTRPAIGVPFPISLTPGAYADVSDVSVRNCNVDVSLPGTYLALPIALETSKGYAAPEDSLSVRLRIAPSGVTLSSLADVVPRTALRRGPNESEYSPDWIYAPAASKNSTAPACAIPTIPGDSIQTFVHRNQFGVITLSPPSKEWWYLAGRSQRLALFIDSSAANLVKRDPAAAAVYADFLASYDSVVAPIIDTYTRGIRDVNGSRTIVVFAPPATSAWAMANEYPRTDCGTGDYNYAAGHAFSIPIQTTLVAGHLLLALHEAAHIADLSWPETKRTESWAVEGYAEMISRLLGLRGPGDALLGNYADGTKWFSFRNSAAGTTCVAPDRRLPGLPPLSPRWQTYVYTYGCFVIQYLVAQAALASGRPTSEFTKAWSAIANRASFDAASGALWGSTRPATSRLAEWFLSWYTDDRYSATLPTLQHPTWNIGAVLAANPGLPHLPIPDVVLDTRGGALTFDFSAPDVRYIQFQSVPNMQVKIDMPDGTPIPAQRLGLAIFRVR